MESTAIEVCNLLMGYLDKIIEPDDKEEIKKNIENFVIRGIGSQNNLLSSLYDLEVKVFSGFDPNILVFAIAEQDVNKFLVKAEGLLGREQIKLTTQEVK